MTRRTRTSADRGEAPSPGGTRTQAEQLTLSYCCECVYYTWKSSDSTGACILGLLPKMMFEALALPCSQSAATRPELCTQADPALWSSSICHPISYSAMSPYASSSHICGVLIVFWHFIFGLGGKVIWHYRILNSFESGQR